MTCLSKRVLRNRTSSFVGWRVVGIVLAIASVQKVKGEQFAPPAQNSSGKAHVEFFVSPHGNNAWSGRLSDPSATDGPFATLERARDAIRALRRTQGSQISVRVTIRGGTYYLDSPLEFGPEDSGTQGAAVVYTAAPGENVVISGGCRLKGGRWAEVNGQKAWVIDIPDVKEGRWNFRQLFVNGERRPRTRLPKEGFYSIKAVPEHDASQGGNDVNGDRGFVYVGTDIKPWHNLQDVEIVAVATCTANRLPIQSVDAEQHLVTFDRISRGPLMYGGRPIYWVENIFEALDTPGQWYLDRSLGRLYCLPKPDEDLGKVEIIAPRLPQLVSVEGTRDAPVKYLHFDGLTFEYTEWLEPPDWPREGRYTGAWYDLPAAIRLTHARECAVTQCVIEHGVAYGIEVREGCRDVEISRNRMTDLGAGGAKIWFGSARTTVADNEIGPTGMIFMTSYGILVGDSPGNQIIYNHVFDRHYTGILIGWAMYFEESNAYGNVVEHNHIHDIGQGPMGDMGGIYTEGICTGTRIRYNVVHDIRSRMYGGWGIYHDSGADILDEKNLVYRCDPLCVQNTRNIRLENNVFALGAGDQVGPVGTFYVPLEEYSFERNIVYYTKGQAVARCDSPIRNCLFNHNLYWNASGKSVQFGGKSWDEWQATGQDKDSLIADPLFIDPEHGNFRLQPGSPAAKIGFESWDMSTVGPRPSSMVEKGGMAFPGQTWALATPESQGVDGAKLSAAMEYLNRALGDYGGTGTMFIVCNGYEIWAGADSDKEYQIYSATKSFSSTVLGLLIDDGKVTLGTLAKDLEPILAKQYPTVTLRHFATMTSGYNSVGGSYEFDPQGRGDSWNPGPPAPPIFPPGSKFRYWDDAMSQFGSVLTKAAGEPLDRLFKRRIADPIGMTKWRWTENDSPFGRVLSWTGGIYTSSRELARFGHLFLNRGNWNSRQLISASWIDQATSVQVPVSVANDDLPRSCGAGVYGYNWWVNGVKPNGQRLWPGAPPRTFYANGLHNNVCIVIPEWNMVIARTNGGRKDGSANTPDNVDEIWSGFFSRLAEVVTC